MPMERSHYPRRILGRSDSGVADDVRIQSRRNVLVRCRTLCIVLCLTVGGCDTPQEQYVRGATYSYGINGVADPVAATRSFRSAAERGHAKAQYSLALAYVGGFGVPIDLAEAVRWWRQAADQGHSNAQFNLGLAYTHGLGTAESQVAAGRWWRKAAMQGVAAAQFHLGLAHAYGLGVPKDSAEAVRWYRKAAEQGYREAIERLGMAYGNGDGVDRDDAEAERWIALLPHDKCGSVRRRRSWHFPFAGYPWSASEQTIRPELEGMEATGWKVSF